MTLKMIEIKLQHQINNSNTCWWKYCAIKFSFEPCMVGEPSVAKNGGSLRDMDYRHALKSYFFIPFIIVSLLKYLKNFPKDRWCIICNESAALCLSNADGFSDTKRTYSTQKGGGYCYTKFYSCSKIPLLIHINFVFPHKSLYFRNIFSRHYLKQILAIWKILIFNSFNDMHLCQIKYK